MDAIKLYKNEKQVSFHLTLMLIQMQSKMQNWLVIRCGLVVMIWHQGSGTSLVSMEDWAELKNFLPFI